VKTVELTDATGTLAEYSTAGDRDPLVVVRRGKPIAALIALPDDVDLESLSLSTNPEFLALLERSRDSLKRDGGLTNTEMRRRVENMNRDQ
jgi:PHD/YefM family antitoxin component YafN of YafNO toxin-antitoxin module